MSGLIRVGRSAAEIIAWLRAFWARRGTPGMGLVFVIRPRPAEDAPGGQLELPESRPALPPGEIMED